MRSITIILVSTLLAAMAAAPCPAQDPPDDAGKKDKAPPTEIEERAVSTNHTLRLGSGEVKYTATAGTMALKGDEGEPKASVFYIAYMKKGVNDDAARPVTFSFNGGPGSSSVWLHLGLLGPKRVKLGEDGSAYPPPGELVDNEFSLLGSTDLVFIDPVTTGFSRHVKGEDPKQFHGVKEDVKWVGEFIRLFLGRYGRWDSPKFIIGESYGTTRAAGLSSYIQDQHGIFLNGIMLISSVLNFQTTDFDAGNDLPYILFLPTYTATAWYHGKLGSGYDGGLSGALEEAEKFALGEYSSLLMLGDGAPEERRDAAAARLSELTGLSEEYVKNTNLRINIWRFIKELLRDRRLTAGRLDSRFTGRDRDAAGEHPEFDPSYANIHGAFSSAMKSYVREGLGFASDLPYEILTGKVHPWNMGDARRGYLNVAESLRKAICANPSLRIYIASGYFDLATPYMATDYTVSHMGLEEPLRNNIRISYFEAGHMMYIDLTSLKKLSKELNDFIGEAVAD